MDFTGVHYSRMLIPMPTSVQFVKGCRQKSEVSSPAVAYDNGRTFSIVGFGYHWGNFPTLIEAALAYIN